MKIQLTTLLLILNDNQILLAEKKRGFGIGKFNGIGGKVEKDETIEEAMIRETQEEIGVTPTDFNRVATITFDEWANDEENTLKMLKDRKEITKETTRLINLYGYDKVLEILKNI